MEKKEWKGNDVVFVDDRNVNVKYIIFKRIVFDDNLLNSKKDIIKFIENFKLEEILNIEEFKFLVLLKIEEYIKKIYFLEFNLIKLEN